jgi:glycosyltransferase involved in cell wall biosynthesis
MKENLTFLIDQVETGGAEKMLIRLANHFSDMYDCHVFPAIPSNGYNHYDVSHLYLHKYENLKEFGKFRKFYNFFCWIFYLGAKFRKLKPQISISFLERSNVANVIICKLFNIKSVISVRNNLEAQYRDKPKIIKKLIYGILGFFYRKADLIIVVAEQLQDQLVINLKLDKEKLITVYNPQPIDKFQSLAKEPITNSTIEAFIKDKKSIVSVGRLTEQKGLHHLIRAYKKIIVAEPNTVLVILGEGELKDELQQLIDDFQLQKVIRIFNYEKNPFSIVDKCTVFAFPSLWEGIANSLLEAIAIGRPVVTTDCLTGPRELLGYPIELPPLSAPVKLKCGSIIPEMENNKDSREPLTQSEEFLAKELLYYLNDNFYYDGEFGKRKSQDFNDTLIMKRWHTTINNLILNTNSSQYDEC